jgi:hypothetical protein
MRINTILLLTVCIALAGSTAFADTMLIKYRSGKAQTLRLDEPSSTIVSISYQEDNAAVVEPSSSHPAKPGTVGATVESAVPMQKSSGTPQTSGKPGVRIEWAAPLE